MRARHRLCIEQIEERLKCLDKQVEEVAQGERYREQVGWLRCLRGVDTVTAMTILADVTSGSKRATTSPTTSWWWRSRESLLGLSGVCSSQQWRRRPDKQRVLED
mgnify:FL=1